MNNTEIIDLKASRRKNLNNKSSRKRTEINLQKKIEKLLLQFHENAIGLRELEIHGYGIADFVLFNNINNKCNINAYEIKIRDWRKALQQAYRYSYYANQSIVIMPLENIPNGNEKLSLFKTMNIGLWGFDSQENQINKIFTPQKKKPKNNSAKIKALDFIKGKINFCECGK